jgi:DNA polymerase II small subunit
MHSEIIDYAKNKNLIITEDGLGLLNNNNYKEIIDKLEQENKVFLNPEDISKIIIDINNNNNNNNNNKQNDYSVSKIKNESQLNYNFHILDKYDITNKKLSQGKVEDFQKLFLDKYNLISNIIRNRDNFSYTTIENTKRELKNKEVDIIGMVYDKRLTKKENLLLTVDDPTGKIKIVIVNKDEKEFAKQKEILLDNVLGFKCSVLSKDLLVCNEIIYPDIPYINKISTVKDDKYMAIIGDIHIGSKLFLEKEFDEFINWLNLKDEDNKEIVKNIKYLVIAGDLVDGVGIYPKQFDELSITDIYEQYRILENYILRIPKNIEIFIIPGNHDAVRLSDPQPAIPKKLLPRLYEQENIHIMGSPAWVDIEGFKTLIYHGASLHGIYSTIKEATMDKPDLAIKEIIKRRDLMPEYGNRQTFVPIEKNFMVIKEIPDIYIGADVHHHAYSKYKHCHIINTSCWQSITAYQIEKGHIPTLAKIILFNFKDQKILIKDFYKEEKKLEIQE